MEFPLLRDIVVIFALSIAVLLVCHRLRISSVVGFILTGILAGPHGFGLISAIGQVDILAKIGVILLLFTIGMEFSPRRILAMRKGFFIGGALQVGFTILGGFAVAKLVGRPASESLFLGFLLSLSSTAIVLKLLSDRGEGKTPHGNLILAILIFQDVIIVMMMLMIPLLAGEGALPLRDAPIVLGKGALIIGISFFSRLRLFLLFSTMSRGRAAANSFCLRSLRFAFR